MASLRIERDCLPAQFQFQYQFRCAEDIDVDVENPLTIWGNGNVDVNIFPGIVTTATATATAIATATANLLAVLCTPLEVADNNLLFAVVVVEEKDEDEEKSPIIGTKYRLTLTLTFVCIAWVLLREAIAIAIVTAIVAVYRILFCGTLVNNHRGAPRKEATR